MNTALGAMSLPGVAQLALLIPHINPEMWLDTFGKFTLLKQVHLCQSSTMQSFLDAFVDKTEADDKSIRPYHNISFPISDTELSRCAKPQSESILC